MNSGNTPDAKTNAIPTVVNTIKNTRSLVQLRPLVAREWTSHLFFAEQLRRMRYVRRLVTRSATPVSQ